MKVKFYLERKASKTGERAIWCYIREYKETTYLNTGQKVNPEFWDAESQRANLRKTRDNVTKGSLKDLNYFLDAYNNKIIQIERAERTTNPNAGFGIITDAIKKQFDKRKTGLFDIYDLFLTIKRQEVSKESLQKLERVRTLLEEYQKEYHERLDFDNISPIFFSKYYAFLIEKKNMLNNTANKNIQFLKTFLIWANTNGYTSNNSYKAFRGKSEVNEVIYLTENELMHLYNLQIDDERLRRVRDTFAFQCFTGVRYSDIENISTEDIKGATWTVRTQKTHQIIDIPLNGFALSILAKYNEYPQPLPVISNQKMNVYIKELCKKAEINENVKTVKYRGSQRIEKIQPKYEVIGTHTARRTFISLSLQKGMKPDVIMAITGHTTYKMMQKYLKIADEHKRDEMDKTWGTSLRLVSTKSE